MRLRNFLLPVVMVCLFAGCAAPAVNINGAPAASHMNILQNPESGITAYLQAIRTFEKKEGKEVAVIKETVPAIGELVVLDKDTRSLSVFVRVSNPKKSEYSLWEVHDLTYHNKDYPYHIEHKLYSGSLSFKEVLIECPSENVSSGAVRVEIRDKDGDPMFMVGSIVFERKGVVPGK